MSTVLEEKMPRIHSYLAERYGQLSSSAVDAVSHGIKTAVLLGITSNREITANFGSLAGADKSQDGLIPINGTKISEAANVPSPEQVFPEQFKGIEKAQNAELSAFAKNVFGVNGSLKSLEERGIIIICKPSESSETKEILVPAGSQDLTAKGIIINGRQNMTESLTETGVVGPEYRTLGLMDETLRKTLKLQQGFQPFNLPLKA